MEPGLALTCPDRTPVLGMDSGRWWEKKWRLDFCQDGGVHVRRLTYASSDRYRWSFLIGAVQDNHPILKKSNPYFGRSVPWKSDRLIWPFTARRNTSNETKPSGWFAAV
jgi:hypothetical protein